MTPRLPLLFVLIAAPAASAAPPGVDAVAPGAVTRGGVGTLRLKGSHLTPPQELLFYGDGVTCTKLVPTDADTVTVTLQITADCKLGEQAFRLRTPGGVSDLLTFRVTPFPIVAELEPNDAKHPQAVPLNVTVAGVIQATGVDHYAVSLKKGQRFAAEVEAIRLGASPTDALLTVFGPDGQLLAANDDNPLFHQDPFVTLVAKVDGVHTVAVREANYGGGPTSRYLLHVGTFCRPRVVFPAGGQAGTALDVKLLGDAAGEHSQSVKLPAVGVPFALYPNDGHGPPAPTANPFRVSPFPNVLEGEAEVAAWPVALNGVLAKPGEADEFRFRAAKGDAIDVSAFAYRVGSPADTVLDIRHPGGELLRRTDDDDTHDSRTAVVIPADGVYTIRVTDKRGQGGADFVYRVEITRSEPGLAVFLAGGGRKSQRDTVVSIPQGGRVSAFLAVRRDGFAGPVAVSADRLPDGVSLGLRPLAAGEYLMPVVFAAAGDAPIGGQLVGLTGTGGESSRPVTGGFKQLVILSRGPGDAALHAVELSKLAVVVTGPAPFAVDLAPPAAPLAPDGTLDVTVKVTRQPGFAGPLTIRFPALPPGVAPPDAVTIAADKTEAVVTLSASPQAELGEWPLIAEAKVAETSSRGRDALAVGMNGLGTPTPRRRRAAPMEEVAVCSALTPLRIGAAAVGGHFESAAIEQGQSGKLVCIFETPLPTPRTATLDGLPPRATAQSLALPAGATRAEFIIVTEPTTPPGVHAGLVCELAGRVGGANTVNRVGRGGALRIEAPGAARPGADGKPLSPLDALRQSKKK